MNEHPPEKRIRLVLLDDHVLFRASLSRVLALEPGFEVAGECGTAAEALEVLKNSGADVILLDFDATEGNDFMSAARQSGYQGRFLIVAGTLDVRKSAVALTRGAAGIFLKSESLDRLVQAIRLVANDELWIEPKVVQLLAGKVIDQYPGVEPSRSGETLGERERHVLRGILGGLTNKRIGDDMGLSESSIKNIVQRLFGRAGVKTRSQLVRVALEGTLDTGPELITRHPKETAMAARNKTHEARHRGRAPLPS
jgi:two-component system, NarL family, nitrate/nitrite response regulator NarL